MKNKSFAPMLAPNEQPNLDELSYSLLASSKMDGIRCIFYKGQILSRSLKQIQNRQLREKFEQIRKYSEEKDLILDGEIYSPNLTFQEITSFVMTQDFEDKESIKKFGKVMKIPEHLKFYCFDCIENDDFDKPFNKRLERVFLLCKFFENEMMYVSHRLIVSKEIIEEEFENQLKNGYEGLILRNPKGKYKCGRGTIKEGLIYKIKPFLDFDGKIIDVIQATKVDDNAEKSINELGYSKTSRKKNDRILIEKAAAFLVLYEGKELKVTIAMTDEEKKDIWKNRDSYIGRWITYKGMLIGAKNVIRHPVFIRFREDKQ